MSKTTGRNRRGSSAVTTKSGKTITINRSLSDRSKARKATQSADKAAYLATLPKEPWKRILYRMHPKRLAHYWFSRQGGIMALKIIGVSIVVGFFMTIGLFAYFRKDLPKIKDIGGSDLGGSNTYFDRTNKTVLWQDYDAVKRIAVDENQISPYMKQATVAIEDKDFFKHGAFDVRGIIRAGAHDVVGGGGAVQGGSTISQQVVKLNEQWTTNRTVTRKVKELILATELEREYSKKEILTGYLNIAPYGGVLYGVESASRDYFQTSAKDLTLAQASMLAAIPQSPSYYSPYASSKYNSQVVTDSFSKPSLLGRQSYILNQMVLQGYITKTQADAAKKVDILAQIHPQTPKYQDIQAPYFVLAAKQELQQKFGATTVKRGGWNITTTVDLNLQKKAEDLVASNVRNVTRLTSGLADEQAIVVEDVHSGQMVAVVGGVDFNDTDHGKLNFAATQKISPGSSFKPYDYATLIDNNNNVGAGSVLYDNQTAANTLPGYPCTDHGKPPPKGTGNCLADYDFLNPGPITLRYALGGSRNIPAVKAMYEAVPNDKSPDKHDSVNKVLSTASSMMYNPYLEGRHEKTYNCYDPHKIQDVNSATKADITQCGGSAAIGDGAYLHLDDHVNGIATLARLGQAIPRTYLLKIIDSSKHDIELPKYKPRQAIKADAAFIVDNMASDPNASYLPAGDFKFHRFNGWDFAIKTGTTNSSFDGLMASWSNKYAVVSWVGNHTRNVDITKNNSGTTMELLTAPLTRGMMRYAHTDVKPDNWVQPTTVKTAPAFIQRAHVHFGDVEPGPTNDLFPNWYVGGAPTKNSSQTLDKVTGKVATSCTPPLAKNLVSNGNAASWNIDIFNGGKQSIGASSTGAGGPTTAANDDVHNCNDSPPTVTLTAPASCDTSCIITATVTQGTHQLSDPQYAQFPGNITISIDGQNIHTQNVSDSPSTVSFTYNPTASGSGTLTAIVTDSVLYQGKASSPLNFTVATPTAAASPITIGSVAAAGPSASIQWSGGSGPFTAFLNSVASSTCKNIPANNCTVTGLHPGANTIYVKEDNSDNQSAPITVNR